MGRKLALLVGVIVLFVAAPLAVLATRVERRVLAVAHAQINERLDATVGWEDADGQPE
jgi:hypothetical protein